MPEYELAKKVGSENVYSSDLLELFENIPEEERQLGVWVMTDLMLIWIKGLLASNGEPLNIWRDDGSEHGQLLTRPVMLDNRVAAGIRFVVFTRAEHAQRHLDLLRALNELLVDYPEDSSVMLDNFVEWAGQQADDPSYPNLKVHRPYERTFFS